MRLASVAPVSIVALIAASGCFLGGSSPDVNRDAAADSGPTTLSFTPDSPYTYVAKVKNVLIGLPPTDAEVKSVLDASDPRAALQTLIKGWMTLVDPHSAEGTTYYAEKMLVFFKLATQQTQISSSDMTDQSPRGSQIVPTKFDGKMMQNITESFARTMIDQVVSGSQPATQAITTTKFMMTTALMELYAYMDANQVNDSGATIDGFATKNPNVKIVLEATTVPTSESVDRTSSSFMHWSDPTVGASKTNIPAGCDVDPLPIGNASLTLYYLLYGEVWYHGGVNGIDCAPYVGASQIGNPATGGANDFDDWREVTITQPSAGEPTTDFWNVPALRKANSLVLNVPRVGFFSTPAFFANWQTNASNEMRVTMNQTLIVSLGAMVDGTDPTMPDPVDGGLPGLDTAHASDTACYGCHKLLDPTRSLLASTYSWGYHLQDNGSIAAQKGEFAFHGVIAHPNTVFDLASTLATHPLFAPGWVQKLCYYARSQACEASDPEFQRVVQDFQNGGQSWNDLVVDLLSSPLVTNAEPTQTVTDPSGGGVIVAVARRDHLCAALNFRLGFADVCAILPTTAPVSTTVAQIAGGLPSDGYGRGSIAPVLPNDPSLFYRDGVENVCEAIAPLVIDAAHPLANVKQWSSASAASVDQAITDFVEILLGLVPSDPRHDAVRAALAAQYAASIAAVDPATSKPYTPTNALESTFISACVAPSAISIGL